MYRVPRHAVVQRVGQCGHRQQRRRFRETYSVNTVGHVDETELGPKQIVEMLNSYVIGQSSAKQEVSVAVRERWRRLQLPEEKAEEITPKNMLVSGPSGCGKTEIIRRVSKLLHAPFVKVDASTFTRRGVVGANVSDMIVDLYDAAEDQCRNSFAKVVKSVARRAAEDIIVECMHTEAVRRGSSSTHAATPAPQPTPPPSHPTPAELRSVLSGLQEKLRAGSGGTHQVVVVSDSGGSGGSDDTDGGTGGTDGEDGEFNEHLAEVLQKPLQEIASMPPQEAKEYILSRVRHMEQTTGKAPRFQYQMMKRSVKIESGETEDTVVLTMQRGQDRSFPQILFGGPPVEGTPDSGTVKELLKWLEEKILEALSTYRFSPSRSPVKDMVEKWGIVCIDEIDKVVGKKAEGGSNERWMNTDVQQELLTLIEGTKVNLESARSLKGGGFFQGIKMGPGEKVVIDTTHILFVCAGAFTLCKPRDMLVELLGRLPVRVEIHPLTEEDLFQILTSTKYPMIQQQVDLFSTEGVELKWEDDAVRQVAHVAWCINNETENTGARVLSSVLRSILSDYSYRAEEYRNQTITITKQHVIDTTKSLLPPAKLEKYVL